MSSPTLALFAVLLLSQPVDLRKVRHDLEDPSVAVRMSAVSTLEQAKKADSVFPLLVAAEDTDKGVREAAVSALVALLSEGVYESREACWVLGDRVLPYAEKCFPTASLDGKLSLLYMLWHIDTPKAVDLIIGAVSDHSSEVRRTAISHLRRPEHEPARTAILLRLKDTDAKVRAGATFALGSMKDRESLSRLIALTRDPNSEIRATAARSLFFRQDASAGTALLKLLSDPVAEVREHAAGALGRIKEKRAVTPLMKLVADPAPKVRSEAISALGQIGDLRALTLLIRVAEHPIPEKAKSDNEDEEDIFYMPDHDEALLALGLLKAPEAIKTLIDALSHPRLHIVASVALEQQLSVELVPKLLTASKAATPEVRKAIVRILAKIDHDSARSAVIAALEDDDADVSRAALDEIKDTHPDIERLLVQCLDSKQEALRDTALWRIGRGNFSKVYPRVIAIATDTSDPSRDAAVRCIGQIADPQFTEILVAAFTDSAEAVRRAAIGWTRKIRDPRAVEPLITFLNSEDDYLVRDAADALGKIGDPRAVNPLIELLRLRAAPESEGLWISDPRCDAATALGLIGDRRAVEPLIEALSDKRNSLRSRSAIALGQLGDRRAVPALRKALATAEPAYHFAFAAALAQFGDGSGLADLLCYAIKPAGGSHGQFPAIEAMDALGKLQDRRAVTTLIFCLRSDSGWKERGVIAAARALGNIGDRRALPALEAAREQEDPAARKEVETAIAAISAR